MNATLKRWGTRAVMALLLGGGLGAGAGMITVNRLEPGRGTGVDSLAVMLDSLARGNVPAARGGASGAAPSTLAAPPAAPVEAPVVAPAELVAVPALEGLEEGAARNALLDAGLVVGEIEFRASSRPAGTVLASVPAAGAQLAPESPVTLILSDGRSTDPDTLAVPAPSSPSPSSS